MEEKALGWNARRGLSNGSTLPLLRSNSSLQPACVHQVLPKRARNSGTLRFTLGVPRAFRSPHPEPCAATRWPRSRGSWDETARLGSAFRLVDVPGLVRHVSRPG